MKRVAAVLMIGASFTLFGGSAALAAYPPSDTQPPSVAAAPPTIAVSPSSASRQPVLPSTGSNSTMSALLIAAGLSGSGVLIVGSVRRRRAG